MKIEMGESLIYSWFRQIKDCQLTQTNWKTSPNWQLNHRTEIENMFDELKIIFGVGLFKKTASIEQLLRQGECDVLAVNLNNGIQKYYAADVAYHEKGLNYGSRNETIMKVVAKYIRTAFCLYGYFDAKDGEIFFASPKISKGIYNELVKHVAYLNQYFAQKGLSFEFKLIGNEDFGEMMFTTLAATSDASDTSELLVRAYKLIEMFAAKSGKASKSTTNAFVSVSTPNSTVCNQMKVGAIVRSILKDILEKGAVSKQELVDLQDATYCKSVFGISHPLLVLEGNSYDEKRYYADLIEINKNKYYMCNDWYERHRAGLQNWIDNHP